MSIGPPLSLQEELEKERAEEVEAERSLLPERVVEQQVQVSRLEAALQAARHRRGSEGEVIAANTKYNIPNTRDCSPRLTSIPARHPAPNPVTIENEASWRE